jgi:hypothetical protein
MQQTYAFVSKCKILREYLSTVQPGPITEVTTLQLLLADSWNELSVDFRGGMQPDKLYRPIESCVWEPPLLTFIIERHGGTVCGSSRADLQEWTINVNTCTAECAVVGHRQIRKLQPKLDLEPLSHEIAELVLQGRALENRPATPITGSNLPIKSRLRFPYVLTGSTNGFRAYP